LLHLVGFSILLYLTDNHWVGGLVGHSTSLVMVKKGTWQTMYVLI